MSERTKVVELEHSDGIAIRIPHVVVSDFVFASTRHNHGINDINGLIQSATATFKMFGLTCA